MRKPVRRVTVGGVDLWERFGLVLTDESAYSPPAPKVYQVDIPGGDGCVDVTESLAGDVAYSNRSMELCFVVAHPEDFEATKTAVCGFLHGRSFDLVSLESSPCVERAAAFTAFRDFWRLVVSAPSLIVRPL